jgi:hypothetical protein
MTMKNDIVEDNEVLDITPIKQKRGRKPKKDLEKNVNNTNNVNCDIVEKIQTQVSNNFFTTTLNSDLKINLDDSTENNFIINENDNTNTVQKLGAKKRGRKPKGGKIIQQIVSLNDNKETKPNVILHLKCSLKDLVNNSLLSSNVESYNFYNNNNNPSDLPYEIISSSEIKEFDNTKCNNNEYENKINNDNYTDYEEDNKDCEIRGIWKKIKSLEHNLHINNISDKKSACFWDTCEFDNPPIYIPKHFINNSYEVYGCFCSPECATSFLMNEHIDSSAKFERYHLLNHIYGKIYGYNKNIKPAANPYYILDKYYGNLSIQEYRSLLSNDRLFLIVDKPLTRILPELHEDNDDLIINNKIIPSGTYQIKKKIQKKTQSKNNILNEKFGLAQ